jgi:threonyl-tRNA synthetase
VEGDLPVGFERPVIIHRAILGSVERMFAILVEHFAGKWYALCYCEVGTHIFAYPPLLTSVPMVAGACDRPFWISPRQLCVVPVSQENIPYGEIVRERMFRAGFEVILENSKKTLNKKVGRSCPPQLSPAHARTSRPPLGHWLALPCVQ